MKPSQQAPRFDPSSISHSRKEKFLMSLSEDDFRDEVVFRVIAREGNGICIDTCGMDEEGKDGIVFRKGAMGIPEMVAIQTKAGKITMASKPTINVETVIAQMKTALNSKYPDHVSKRKVRPDQAILCASGRISTSAKRHIVDSVSDARLKFLDSQDIIPLVDEHYPEFWFGVDSMKFPYLAALLDQLSSGTISNGSIDSFLLPATPKDCVPLMIHSVRIQASKGKKGARAELVENQFISLRRGKENCILVVGDPGSGKSTCLRRLVSVVATEEIKKKNGVKIPVLLRAPEIASSEGNLTEIALQKTTSVSSENKPGFDTADLAKGLVLLCIDALDEIAVVETRNGVMAKINSFIAENPKCKVILTSRDYTWLSELDGIGNFKKYRISPIGWSETVEIVKKMRERKCLSGPDQKMVLRRLKDVHGMQMSPLLVTIFASSTDINRRDMPANISELMKKFVETMLGRWDAAKGLAQQFHGPLKEFLVGRIALNMHRERRTSLPIEAVLAILNRELKERGHSADANMLVDEAVFRSGLFRVIGDQIEFSHLMLQEFFAGTALKGEEIEALVEEEWWQQPIVFHFGANPSESKILKQIFSSFGGRAHVELRVATCLGLSLQACYLSLLTEKEELFIETVRLLSKAREWCHAPDSSLLSFLSPCLLGKEGVACSVLREREDTIRQRLLDDGSIDEDLSEFWQILGLVECDQISEAESRIRQFLPKDARLWLAIHLSVFYFSAFRAEGKQSKASAKRVLAWLSDKTQGFREMLREEIEGELLEYRKGKVVALEDPRSQE